jgi:hypothetical protein
MGAADQFEHELSETIRTHAMTFPETTEGSSCVNRAFKAGGKNFVFVGEKEYETNMRLKLGDSIPEIAKLAKTDPDRWQVGKGGWALLRFDPDNPPPNDDLERWITESFRLLAPKKIVAQLAD